MNVNVNGNEKRVDLMGANEWESEESGMFSDRRQNDPDYERFDNKIKRIYTCLYGTFNMFTFGSMCSAYLFILVWLDCFMASGGYETV